MPASAILPLPTTRSSYCSPLGSLCTLPVPGAPGIDAVVEVEGVVAGAEAAGVDGGVVVMAPAVVDDDELDSLDVWLQPAASTAAAIASAARRLCMRILLDAAVTRGGVGQR